MNYKIFTDIGCDIPADLLKEWDIPCVDLTFRADGVDTVYVSADMPIGEFYRQMREGSVFKTAAANMADFEAAFEPVLAAGQDILYIGALSGS